MFDRFARYYDADYGAFSDDILFYRELARLHGGPVLELMCGTGRVAVPLAQARLSVVGLDIAPAMIAIAESRASAAQVGKRARFAVGDARQFEWPERFGFAFIAINSFMHLETAADQLAALRTIHRHLAPGGTLAIDLFNPNPAELAQVDGLTVLDKTFVLPDSGHTVQKYVIREVDLAAQHQAVTFCYDEIDGDGRLSRTVLPFGMRWLYRFEAEHILARAGFVVDHIYGSYDLDDYTSDAPRMLVVARRLDEVSP